MLSDHLDSSLKVAVYLLEQIISLLTLVTLSSSVILWCGGVFVGCLFSTHEAQRI